MCEQTMPYTVGSWVWCKLFNRIWWPGKVVDKSDTPDDFKLHTIKQKNYIAIVYFERDNSYECVTNMEKVFLYSCAKKMEFVRKGYSLFMKQKRGERVTGNFAMSNFIEDVVSIENAIGGNIDIFEDLRKETDNSSSVSKMIKELFVTSKDKKKNARKSLPSIITTPVSKEKVSMQKHTPSTPQTQQVGTYMCYFQKGCAFSTNRYEALKRHVNMHKAEGPAKTNNADVKPKPVVRSPPKPNAKPSESSASTSKASQKVNKRKTEKNIKLSNKKIKLEDEILKDWDDGDEENSYEDIVQNIEEKVAETTSNIKPSTNRVDFDGKDYCILNESSSVSNRFESIVHESGNETDTDELDQLNESNEFMDINNDQNSTISYTENTSDQMMVLEKSVSNLSCNVNESNESDILMKNNKVIDNDGKMIMGCVSSNTYVNNETDGLRNDDNMLVENGVEPKDNLIVSIMDKEDSINQKIKKTPEKKVDSAKTDSRYECLYDGLIKPNWMDMEKWTSKITPAVMEEVQRTLTYEKTPSYLALPKTRRKPQMSDVNLELKPDYEVIPPSQWRSRRVWLEVQEPPTKVYTNEELNAMPVIKNLMKKINSGEPHNAFLTIEGANFFPENESENEN